MSNILATIITIGDELLIGQTIDTNSAWIAQQLNILGIDVLRRVAVGDTKEAIVTALDEEIEKVGLLILTGGLGPTSDDITKPLLCEYFGGKLKTDKRVEEHLKALFAARNRPILERNMKQAEVPDNCAVLFNKMGTAPGMWFERNGKVVISLPGVPFEMKAIMTSEALPRIKAQFKNVPIVHRTLFTAGEGESVIADKLASIEEALPAHLKLAYLPDSGFVKLRLTGKGGNLEKLIAEVDAKMSRIANRLGKIVVAREDAPLEKLIGDSLKEQGKTLGLAESCSGGFIAHHITQIPGSSAYFKGSIVTYTNEIKTKILGVKLTTLDTYGAVSEETAKEMVAGAHSLLNVDYALSITGLLGPGGDEKEKAKPGTVWMAVTNGEKTLTKEFHFYYDRERNKEMATKNALLFIWKLINNRF